MKGLKAIELLNKNNKGFFLKVGVLKIDWAGLLTIWII